MWASIAKTATIHTLKIGAESISKMFMDRLQRVVESISDLREVDSNKFKKVTVESYYGDGGDGGGNFVADESDTVSEDNGGTVIVALDGMRWKRVITADHINLKWFGAKGDNVTDDQSAIEKFIDVWIVGTLAGYVPRGIYRHTGRFLVNVALNPSRIMPELRGDGPYSSKFVSSSVVEPVYHIYGSAVGPDHFQGKISRIGFQADVTGVAASIGLSDFSDNHGNYTIDQCYFGNGNTGGGASAITLQLNWLFDCHFMNTVVVGRPMYGTALQLRQVQFSKFDGGSYSNADKGVQVSDGGTYNVSFDTVDIENVRIGIYVDDVYAEYLRFVNPYIDIQNPGVGYPGGGYPFFVGDANIGGVTIEGARFGRLESYVYDNGSSWGVPGAISPSTDYERLLLRGMYPGQQTPALPASDIGEYNTTGQVQIVTVWGGTVTAIFLNAVEHPFTGGQFVINPGDVIAVRYSVAPNWRWQAMP